MAPMVRLALALGLKHSDLARLLRSLFIREASASWRLQGCEPTVSQISVTTGLNRKAVAASLATSTDTLPRSDSSAAARTLTLWMEMAAGSAQCMSLPLSAKSGAMSFELLARRASRGNVHHRTVLEELVRLELATERDGIVELTADGFVPAADLRLMLAFLSDHTEDHLLAGTLNTLGEGAPLLEHSLAATGMEPARVAFVHNVARQRWSVLQDELAREMRRSIDGADGAGGVRMRVGFYAYFEDEKSNREALNSGGTS